MITLDRLRKIVQDGKEIIVSNFSGLKEDQMIELVSKSRTMVIREGTPKRMLAIFNSKTFITPKFMRHIETDQLESIPFQIKQAVVGVSETQKTIMMGYNMFRKRSVRSFETEKQAIDYLLED